MTKMDAITAGSGATYRIELVYLNATRCTGCRASHGVGRNEHAPMKEWQTGARRGPTTAAGGVAARPGQQAWRRPAAHPRR